MVDVCLMVIAVLSQSFSKRADLQTMLNKKFTVLVPIFLKLEKFKSLVGPNFAELTAMFSTPLLQHRMVLCIGQVVESLLNTN